MHLHAPGWPAQWVAPPTTLLPSLLAVTLSACGITTQTVCGDGILQFGETCDPALIIGQPGACPQQCEDGNPCTTDKLVGDPALCTAVCQHGPSPGCKAGCGDGVLQPHELCDPAIPPEAPGACPASCDDGSACTVDSRSGTPKDCSVQCKHTSIRDCVAGDGCCPLGCPPQVDSDCTDVCGNGILGPNELCDPLIPEGAPGACPTRCDDGKVCTSDRLLGDPSHCNVRCEFRTISYCEPGDGCCPWICGFYDDSDCPPPAGGAGVPCTTDSDCLLPGAAPGLRCLTQEQTGWPGGVCSLGCMTQGDCPQASRCVDLAEIKERVCLPGCLDDVDCKRPGHACLGGAQQGAAQQGSAQQAGAQQVCVPRADGPLGAPIGTSCTSTRQCSGDTLGFCLTEAGHGFKTGYCSQRCGAGRPCRPESHCLLDAPTGRQLCAGGCRSRVDCGPAVHAGVDCYDADRDGVLECWRGFGRIGDPCSEPGHCLGGECLTGMLWPAGYCSQTCNAGTPGVCPDGGRCSVLPGNKCLAACMTSSECREGYQCGRLLVCE